MRKNIFNFLKMDFTTRKIQILCLIERTFTEQDFFYAKEKNSEITEAFLTYVDFLKYQWSIINTFDPEQFVSVELFTQYSSTVSLMNKKDMSPEPIRGFIFNKYGKLVLF